MSTSTSKSRRLRELITQGCVIMPGVPNAGMARQVEHAGFDAVYLSGAGMANATAGVPDIGLLTLTEVAQLANYVANAVEIPAIVDADTGFGGAENVARTIRELERAGRYLEAGADAIFPEALQRADEFKAFAREVKAPLLANMTEFGKSPLL